MSVLLDATRHRLILAYYTSNIPHAYNLSCGCVVVNNLVSDFFLAVLHRLDMDGYLLVVVADAATHRGDTLGLQTSEEQLLPDAVGLQPLTVYV